VVQAKSDLPDTFKDLPTGVTSPAFQLELGRPKVSRRRFPGCDQTDGLTRQRANNQQARRPGRTNDRRPSCPLDHVGQTRTQAHRKRPYRVIILYRAMGHAPKPSLALQAPSHRRSVGAPPGPDFRQGVGLVGSSAASRMLPSRPASTSGKYSCERHFHSQWDCAFQTAVRLGRICRIPALNCREFGRLGLALAQTDASAGIFGPHRLKLEV